MTQQTESLTFELGTVTPDQALLYTQQFITKSGYTDPSNVDKHHDTIIAMGLGLLEDCPPWARGDHVLAIRKRLNRSLTLDEMRQLAKLYKASRSRLANNATTASNWPQERRWASENVGYSHHELLNGRPADEQDALIEMADAQGWSCDQLAAHVYRPTDAPSIVPDNGNASPSIYAGIPDDEPPDNDNTMYKDYEQQAEAYAADAGAYDWTPDALPDDITELAAAIKARYSAGDIATLVAELAAIPY